MRIAIVTATDVSQAGAGGGSRYVEHLANSLSFRHRVTLITFRAPQKLFGRIERLRRGLLEVVVLPCHPASPFARLALLCRPEITDSDLVIESSDKGGPWFAFNARHRILLSHQMWEGAFEEELPPGIGRVARLAEPLFYTGYRQIPIVANSVSTASSLSRIGLSVSRIIPPGVDDKLLTEAFQCPPKLPTPTLIVVGRLRKYKGVQYAISALALISRSVPGIRLIVVGDGPYRHELEDRASREGVQSSVVFKGVVNEWEKWQLLGGAHVLVNGSVQEGFGINVLEANALRTPCVGWDVPGTRDAVRNEVTGLLAKPFDVADLAAKILSLFSDEGRRREMAERARAYAMDFSWSKMELEFDKLVGSLARHS